MVGRKNGGRAEMKTRPRRDMIEAMTGTGTHDGRELKMEG